MTIIAAALEMAGLFAIWNWSRRASALLWLVTGVALLAGAVTTAMGSSPRDYRIYLAAIGIYLLSGLIWAWWKDGLDPSRWCAGEYFVAIAVAVVFGMTAFDFTAAKYHSSQPEANAMQNVGRSIRLSAFS